MVPRGCFIGCYIGFISIWIIGCGGGTNRVRDVPKDGVEIHVYQDVGGIQSSEEFDNEDVSSRDVPNREDVGYDDGRQFDDLDGKRHMDRSEEGDIFRLL